MWNYFFHVIRNDARSNLQRSRFTKLRYLLEGLGCPNFGKNYFQANYRLRKWSQNEAALDGQRKWFFFDFATKNLTLDVEILISSPQTPGICKTMLSRTFLGNPSLKLIARIKLSERGKFFVFFSETFFRFSIKFWKMEKFHFTRFSRQSLNPHGIQVRIFFLFLPHHRIRHYFRKIIFFFSLFSRPFDKLVNR